MVWWMECLGLECVRPRHIGELRTHWHLEGLGAVLPDVPDSLQPATNQGINPEGQYCCHQHNIVHSLGLCHLKSVHFQGGVLTMSPAVVCLDLSRPSLLAMRTLVVVSPAGGWHDAGKQDSAWATRPHMSRTIVLMGAIHFQDTAGGLASSRA